MNQYLKALNYILENGEVRDDRTGVGTISVFGYQSRYVLGDCFPAVTTKKLAWKSVVSELLWFLEGSDDERRLAEILYEKPRCELEDKTTIWTANADAQGKALGYENNKHTKKLGPVYGVQWRKWTQRNPIHNVDVEYDQILTLIKNLKDDPYSRRHILSAWNVAEIDNMALPPCHTMAQFYVNNNKLSCQLYQRSADMFLGVPFNIASYALLTHVLAQICDFELGDFVHTIGDAHIYVNHVEQVKEQIARKPGDLPKLVMPEFSTLSELINCKTSDFKLENYNPMPSIKAPMAV
jgi:thymidylate synthase